MERMRQVKRQAGFTLIELVVAMAVMSILGAAVMGLIKTALSSYDHINEDMAAETEARAALSLVTVQIRQHDQTGAIVLNPDGSLKFLDAPGDISSSGSIIWFNTADSGLYAQDYGNLNNTTTAGPPNKIASITNFSVTRDDNGGTGPYTYNITISYGTGENARALSQDVTQRSAPTT